MTSQTAPHIRKDWCRPWAIRRDLGLSDRFRLVADGQVQRLSDWCRRDLLLLHIGIPSFGVPSTSHIVVNCAHARVAWAASKDGIQSQGMKEFDGQRLIRGFETMLKTEIKEAIWATLHSDTSRPFAKSKSGRIAVKMIGHLRDEGTKVFKVAP